jgi:hypothetical protein
MTAEGAIVLLVIAAFVGLTVVGFTVAIRHALRTSAEHGRGLAAFEERIAALTPLPDDAALANMPFLDLVDTSERTATKVRGGTIDGLEIRVFELRYTEPPWRRDKWDAEHDRDTSRVLTTVVALRSRALPPISILPLTLPLLRQAYEGRYADRVLTESNDFDDRFYVTSPEPRVAHALLDPGVMAWLLQRLAHYIAKGDPRMASREFHFADRYIRVTVERPSATALNDAVFDLRELIERIPSAVYQVAPVAATP